MILASLSDTLVGAAVGGVLTSYGTSNKEKEDTLTTISTGTFWGAVAPSLIKVTHTVASSALALLAFVFESLKDAVLNFKNDFCSFAKANPVLAASAGLVAAGALGLYCKYGHKCPKAARAAPAGAAAPATAGV